MIEIREYLTDQGTCPYADWFNTLEPRAAAKATTAKTKLEQGLVTTLKAVGDGVFEYKIDYGPGYRIYLAQEGTRFILLLGGGDKRRQQQDIHKAKQCWNDYRARLAQAKQQQPRKTKRDP